jgi:DNA-binding CsgD family transcriptional regulator
MTPSPGSLGVRLNPESLRRLAELMARSRRKREICVLVSYGHRTKEIAGLLEVSPHTVNTYLNEIYREVGVHDRALLARLVAQIEPSATHLF